MLPSALVVGYGSIGQRHATVLQKIGVDVAVVSSRIDCHFTVYRTIEDALASQRFDYVIVATTTAKHFLDLQCLINLGYSKRVMVEKPLFHLPMNVPSHSFSQIVVGYNLRFHPLLKRLKSKLLGQRLVSMVCYAGSYLPTWRPGRNYWESYSARRADGGGVLRDLSHEIDYMLWLGGYGASGAVGVLGHFSDLRIETEDVACFTFSTAECPAATCYLSYADVIPRRRLIVNTTTTTFELDLINNTLYDGSETISVTLERNDTYQSMHAAVLDDHVDGACSLEQGGEVVKFIETLESQFLSDN